MYHIIIGRILDTEEVLIANSEGERMRVEYSKVIDLPWVLNFDNKGYKKGKSFEDCVDNFKDLPCYNLNLQAVGTKKFIKIKNCPILIIDTQGKVYTTDKEKYNKALKEHEWYEYKHIYSSITPKEVGLSLRPIFNMYTELKKRLLLMESDAKTANYNNIFLNSKIDTAVKEWRDKYMGHIDGTKILAVGYVESTDIIEVFHDFDKATETYKVTIISKDAVRYETCPNLRGIYNFSLGIICKPYKYFYRYPYGSSFSTMNCETILMMRTNTTNIKKLGETAWIMLNSVCAKVYDESGYIGDYSFTENYSLQHISFPKNVHTLGDYAFKGCFYLNTITIPETVTSIGEYCFKACFGLATVKLPSNLTNLPANCFEGCTRLDTSCIDNYKI